MLSKKDIIILKKNRLLIKENKLLKKFNFELKNNVSDNGNFITDLIRNRKWKKKQTVLDVIYIKNDYVIILKLYKDKNNIYSIVKRNVKNECRRTITKNERLQF